MTSQSRDEAARHRPCARTSAGQEARCWERSVPSRTGLGAIVPAPSPGHALSVLRGTSCKLRGWFHFSQSRQRSLRRWPVPVRDAVERRRRGERRSHGRVYSPALGADVAPSPEPHCWLPG